METTSTFLPPLHAPRSRGTGSQGWPNPGGAGDFAREVIERVAKWLRSGSLGRRGLEERVSASVGMVAVAERAAGTCRRAQGAGGCGAQQPLSTAGKCSLCSPLAPSLV